MGCGGSKQDVATSNAASYRRLLKKKSGAAKSKTSNAAVPETDDVTPLDARPADKSKRPSTHIEKAEVGNPTALPSGRDGGERLPPPPTAVKDITMNELEGNNKAYDEEEEEEGKLVSRADSPDDDRYFSSRKDEEYSVEAVVGGGEYYSPRYEPDGNKVEDFYGVVEETEEGRGLAAGTKSAAPRDEINGKLSGKVSVDLKDPILVEETKESYNVPLRFCDFCKASKACAHKSGLRDQEAHFPHERDIKDIEVDNLRRQLKQLAERLARFEIWGQDDDGCDDEECVNPFHPCTPRRELNYNVDEDLQVTNQSIFDDDQIDDGLTFEEDFSDKVPVYDEDPLDQIQIPNFNGDPLVEENIITSSLSFDEEGVSGDQVKQAMCKKYIKVRRSRLYGGKKKKSGVHNQLHQKKIGKQRKRITKVVH